MLEFERVNGFGLETHPKEINGKVVKSLLEDLKAIFYHPTKYVAPVYYNLIEQIDEDMAVDKTMNFNRLSSRMAYRRDRGKIPESVLRARKIAEERRAGIFRCGKCDEILDIERPDISWNKATGQYEHLLDCKE